MVPRHPPHATFCGRCLRPRLWPLADRRRLASTSRGRIPKTRRRGGSVDHLKLAPRLEVLWGAGHRYASIQRAYHIFVLLEEAQDGRQRVPGPPRCPRRPGAPASRTGPLLRRTPGAVPCLPRTARRDRPPGLPGRRPAPRRRTPHRRPAGSAEPIGTACPWTSSVPFASGAAMWIR